MQNTDARTVRITASLALGFAALFAAACGDGHAPAPAESRAPVSVETLVAAETTTPDIVEITGTATPITRVSPGTKIMGRVEKVLVREGDRVQAGRTLAVLDSRDLQAAVVQAEAAVMMAEANRENAVAMHRRIVGLHARGSATDKSLDDAVAGLRVAEAGLEQAKANLAAARVVLGYAEVRSPIGGFVTAKRIEAGDMAAPGAPLFTVEDLSRVKVVVQAPEADIVGLSTGESAVISFDVLGQDFDAAIDRIVPAGDPMSRTFEVQLLLDNSGGRIKSGLFARVRFERGGGPKLLAPKTAIVNRGELTGVFVVHPETNRALLRWIRLGRERGDQVEVISGLAPGERYVASPPPGLADGSPVAVSR